MQGRYKVVLEILSTVLLSVMCILNRDAFHELFWKIFLINMMEEAFGFYKVCF